MSDPAQKPDPAPEEKEGGRGGFSLMIMLILLLVILSLGYRAMLAAGRTEVSYSFFLSQLKEGNVRAVVLNGLTIEGTWKNVKPAQEAANELFRSAKQREAEQQKTEPKALAEDDFPKIEDKFVTEAPHQEDQTLIRLLDEHGAEFKSANNDFVTLLLQSLIFAVPFILVMMVVMIALRRSSDPMSSGMFGNFVRSPAKRFRANEHKTTFDDVAGLEHAKVELQEIVEFLKNPAKFQRLGAQIPKGVLLMGSPGTGKTLMARAVAGEAGVPFFSINGSEFIQMFVGVGASRVRDMFRQAKEAAPCILFIDEIDAVGRVRGAGVGGGHDEREQTLNQILSEMDGFQATEAVIVVAATNRPDVLDPALLRPGRFDRHVAVDKPSRDGRVGILKVHSRKVPIASDVDLEEIANSTIGFSGADLKNLVNEAALLAAREGKSEVTRDDFENARDKIMMGVPREETMNEKERRMTAFHEAGHALLAWLLPEVDPVHKVTIVPRGRALGVTQLLPEEERLHMGESRLRQQLAMMLAGRAAEKLIFDEFSAGAEDDLRRASQIARRMVSAWGMSEVIGPVAYRDGEEHPFLGKEIHEQRKYSDQTAFLIDQEMHKVLLQANEQAMQLLQERRSQLEAIANALLVQEVVSRRQLEELIGPKQLRDE